MTREVLQDSLDAAISESIPVIVKFELHQLKQQSFPGIKELQNIFQYAHNTWATHKDASKFFSDGLNILKQPTIPVLAIRDFNTTGLENVDEKISGSFASLVKSVGVTFKGSTASGSFGIGKHAPFAASSIRTMFYGTYNRQNVIALQGVAKLASYDKGNNNFTQGTGYFGVKEVLEPIRDLTGYDPMFKRLEYGTDKFIVGFTGEDDWAEDVIETILLSYLVAIMEGKLEVHIAGLKISAANMSAIVKYIMGKRPTSLAQQYYEAYTSPNRVVQRKYFKTESGRMESIFVSMLVQEGFNRRVAMYRGTGMKIFDKDRFRAPIDFAGVMVIEGDELNASLRKMEPPTHDKWAAGLYNGNQKYAVNLLKQIYDWLNAQARELAKLQVAETIELRGLEGILPDISKVEAPLKKINQQTFTEAIKSYDLKQLATKPKEIKPKKKKKKNPLLEDVPTKLAKKKPQTSGEDKPEKLLKPKKATVGNTRLFCINEEQGLYKFILHAKGNGELNFAVHIVGEDGSKSPIIIKSITNIASGELLTFEGNKVGPLEVIANEKIVLQVQFEENERYSLEVTV